MTRAQKQMLALMDNNVDAYAEGDAPVVQPVGASLGRGRNNPNFSATLQLSLLKYYFTVVTATGVYTEVAAAALDADLKNNLPFFVFGNADYAGGYSKAVSVYPVNANWVFIGSFIYGKDSIPDSVDELDSTVTAKLERGDQLQLYTSAQPGAGTTSLAVLIIRSSQVAMGTLLDSLNSDMFTLNEIRYAIPDSTKIAQFNNQIALFKQTNFGKFNGDYVDPNTFKDPYQQQTNIINVPLKYPIDKNKIIILDTDFDCINISWGIFISVVSRLQN